jgi:arginyl-tRNA synthetase
MEVNGQESFEKRIRSIVEAELARMGAGDSSFAVEWPASLEHGDFAVNAALAASKPLGKQPREIAEAIAVALTRELGEDAEKIEVAGPGFVNMTRSAEALARELASALETSEQWGSSDELTGKRILIEYSCPNPFKEMHIGHLLSTVIGESVARLTQWTGATVFRDSYGGDVGPHVAKALWALKEKGITDPGSARDIGKAYEHGAHAYEESEKAKAEIDALNVALYAALAKDAREHTEEERALLELWRKGKDLALEAFRDIYRVLGTSFDYYFFESEVTPIALDVVNDALNKGIFKKSEGAVIYPGEEKGLHTLVFVTSRGTPTYEAKDIGLAFYKEERIETNEVIIETGAEQVGHFKVFLAALAEIAPQIVAKMSHISHGLLTLTTGKMSSRKGNVITARELLQEVIEKAGERNPDPVIAEQVGVGALKYMILRSAPGGSIVFNPEKSLSLDGDSGPYLQYALVRARAVLEKAETRPDATRTLAPTQLARLITRFPGVVAKAHALKGPHVLVQYLTQLAGEWNSFYAQERIIGTEDEAAKLALVQAFAQTMQNGLWLLGIPAPERM